MELMEVEALAVGIVAFLVGTGFSADDDSFGGGGTGMSSDEGCDFSEEVS